MDGYGRHVPGAYNAQINWADRKNDLDPSQQVLRGTSTNLLTNPGGSYESIIRLANKANKNVWLHIPTMANTAYMTSMAQLFLAQLNPNLIIYFQYSNEVWNFVFGQYLENRWSACAETAPVAWATGFTYAVNDVVSRSGDYYAAVSITTGISGGTGPVATGCTYTPGVSGGYAPSGACQAIVDGGVTWQWITPMVQVGSQSLAYLGEGTATMTDQRNNQDTWAQRRVARQLKLASDAFAAVYPAGSIGTRIRPIHASSAASALNAQQVLLWTQATYGPPSNYFWGGAYAPYFDAANQDESRAATANGSMTNIVVSGGTGTITTSIPHRFLAGDQLILASATTVGINATYAVAASPAPTATTLTITGMTAANGTYTLQTDPNLRIELNADDFLGTATIPSRAQMAIDWQQANYGAPSINVFRGFGLVPVAYESGQDLIGTTNATGKLAAQTDSRMGTLMLRNLQNLQAQGLALANQYDLSSPWAAGTGFWGLYFTDLTVEGAKSQAARQFAALNSSVQNPGRLRYPATRFYAWNQFGTNLGSCNQPCLDYAPNGASSIAVNLGWATQALSPNSPGGAGGGVLGDRGPILKYQVTTDGNGTLKLVPHVIGLGTGYPKAYRLTVNQSTVINFDSITGSIQAGYDAPAMYVPFVPGSNTLEFSQNGYLARANLNTGGSLVVAQPASGGMTITRAGGNWITDQYVVGETVTASGWTNAPNNGSLCTITGVTATVLTFNQGCGSGNGTAETNTTTGQLIGTGSLNLMWFELSDF
jgi:hypothetical protein